MFDEEEVKKSFSQEVRRDKRGKYKPLPRNRQTESAIKKIFEFGTELELVRYLEEQGLPDGSEQSVEIVKLFREHDAKRR